MKTNIAKVMALLEFLCISRIRYTIKGIALLIFLTSFQVNGANLNSESSETTLDLKKTEMVQPDEITGSVTDENGEPLMGVTILVKGTLQGNITDADGNFSIQTDPSSTLVFSFIGYRSKEIVVGNQTEINISLEPDVIGLDEVVAIGYGTQRRNDLTGAISSINADQIESTLNTNLFKSLQGTVPGLRITNDNFEPGSSQNIRIRGENSLSASNNPLIILDGIPYEGDLNDINPIDIESVSVLKDASSAAIYGARSANGVILVTTKMGKVGQLNINLNASVGVSSIANKSISMLNGPDWVAFTQEHILQGGGPPNQDPLEWMLSNVVPQYQAGTETDWMDLVLRNGITQDYTISISGGAGGTTHYTSIGYLDNEGIIENSGFKRVTVRSNIRQDLKEWITLGSNLQFSNSDYGGGSPVPSLSLAMIQSPYGKLYADNGDYEFYPQFPETYYPSPFANDKATIDKINRRAIANVYTEIKPTFIRGLSYKLSFAFDYGNITNASYYPSNSLNGFADSGTADKRSTDNIRWTLENLLRYENNWGNHYINVIGLYSREATTQEYSRLTGRGFVNDDNLYHLINGAETKDAYSELTETNLVSYMGRLHYDYAKKYLLTVTARRDGYSGFGADNKFGFFPSVALGWTISNEEFAQNMGVEFLKLRLSYGINGNQAVVPYQTFDRLQSANTLYGDNTAVVNGLQINSVGNPDLKWEGTKTFDIGVDFAFLNNRISGTVDYYSSSNEDLLMTRQVPVMNGYTSLWYNIGETANKGVELNLSTRNIVRSDFNWTTSFTFSLNRDEIVALRGEGEDDIANLWFVGEPLNVHYGYEYDGLWTYGEEEQFAAYAPDGTFDLHLGKPRVKDTNGDGSITQDDRSVLGNQLPSWTGGLLSDMSYKNWSLTFFINTVQGIERSNGWYNPQSFLTEKAMNFLDVDYWRLDRPSDEFISSVITSDPGYPAASPPLLKDASFIRLQNITLSYELPKSALGKIGISSLSVYIAAHNLITISSWLGWDPEANAWGAPGGGVFYGSIGQGVVPYPSARTFRIGVNLGL